MDLQVGLREADRGFAAVGVPRDIDRVGLVFGELETGKERGVEDGRGELAHAAADIADDDAVFDETARLESLFGGASPNGAVERNGFAWLDDDPGHQVGEELDVVDSVFATRVVGGELANEFDDAEFGGISEDLVGGCDPHRKFDGHGPIAVGNGQSAEKDVDGGFLATDSGVLGGVDDDLAIDHRIQRLAASADATVSQQGLDIDRCLLSINDQDRLAAVVEVAAEPLRSSVGGKRRHIVVHGEAGPAVDDSRGFGN